MIGTLKILVGTLVVVGVILGFMNLKYAPHRLLLESSPKRPTWLPWVGWALSSTSAILYIVLDIFD